VLNLLYLIAKKAFFFAIVVDILHNAAWKEMYKEDKV